jgi:hypothetical protein
VVVVTGAIADGATELTQFLSRQTPVAENRISGERALEAERGFVDAGVLDVVRDAVDHRV